MIIGGSCEKTSTRPVQSEGLGEERNNAMLAWLPTIKASKAVQSELVL